MRSKSASELCTSSWTPRRLPIGKKRRVCRVVNATRVPIEIAPSPREIVQPANQYTSAGMTANVVWIAAIIQRPVMRLRTSSSARRADSSVKRSARSSERPIVFPRRIPETESDSCTIEDTSASDTWRSAVTFFLWSPTRFVRKTNSGSRASANAASRQSRKIIATIVASTVVTFESTDVAVEVTTFSIPPMSFAIRLCTSPVRVRVKNASESRCRWR